MAGMRAGRGGCWAWVVMATLAAIGVLAAAPGALALEAGGLVGAGLAGEAGSLLMQPVGAGQRAAEEEAARAARLSTPEALAEDARSRMEYAGYGRAAAVGLAKRVFGIARPAWVPPQDQGAASVTGYVGEHMAQETLSDGKHLLVSSSLPLRSAMGDGQERPVSLSLGASGFGYAPANPVVPVVIGRSPAEGVSFEGGLRVAPVQHQAPESAEVVGNGIFYPGTAKDVDFMLEPRPLGAEASWQLLSAEAPSENALSFSMPEGARLVMSKEVEGAAEVTLEGQRLLLIMPATATEANGATLRASYTIDGSTLTTHVDLSGSVDFPVDVDPVVWQQKYGGGTGFWAGWQCSGEGLAYFEGGSGNAGILAGIQPNSIPRSYASCAPFAPGWPSEGSITRVDVSGLEHWAGGMSNIETGIVNSNGSVVYTYDGENPNETRSGMMGPTREQILPGRQVAYCAQGAGGYDGGPTPLCNENYGGQYWRMTVDTWETQPGYQQFAMAEANSVTYLDTSSIKAEPSGAVEVAGKTNVLAGAEKWLGPKSGALEAIGSDPAFGVGRLTVSISGGNNEGSAVSREYAREGLCTGMLCAPEERQALAYNSFPGGLPNGNDTIKIEAGDVPGLVAIWTSTVHIDKSPPHGLAISGADVKGETINITEGPAGDQITAEATDGEGSVLSSGIGSLAIEVDGHQEGASEGRCAPGPCTASATWTLNGRELGAGVHTLTLAAIDNAGNEAQRKTYQLVVHAASPVAMGPGSVNPQSGDFALESTDVNLKDGAGALMVTQHYDSRNVNEGAEGPLGPQWGIGLGQLATLEVVESEGKVEGVMVVGPEGLSYFPAKEGGGYESPPGDTSASLALVGNGTEYVLEDKKTGSSTTFTHPAGAKDWMPTVSKAHTATATNLLTDSYKSVEVSQGKVVVEPTEELAPHGTANCPSERERLLADEEAQAKACRALFFYYGGEKATQSEASGESESQWGWHANRLSSVVAVIWSTAASKMEEVPVAEFSYDGQGRLRAEWDPRITPSLKTTYGYDAEGHVTSFSPPGQQPWVFVYGTTGGDGSSGRLLKAMRAHPQAGASEAQVQARLSEERQLLKVTEQPSLSGSAAVGHRMTVSDGKWEGAAVAYAYQWQRCNAGPVECEAIPGASDQNYTPQAADEGHVLRARVTAIDANGAEASETPQSEAVTTTPRYSISWKSQTVDAGSSVNAASCLPETTDCVISDSSGNALYATNVNLNGSTWQNWSGPGASPSEAVECPTSSLCLLAAGAHEGHGGSLYYATSLGGTWSEAYTPAYGVDAIACVSASLCVDGQDNYGYLRYSTNPASTSWTLLSQGSAAMSAASCLPAGFCAIADGAGTVHIAPTKADIEAGTWVATDVDGATPLTGISCISTTLCLAVDDTGNAMALKINASGSVTTVEKHDIDWTNDLTGISCTTAGTCVAGDTNGYLFIINESGNWTAWEDIGGGSLTSASCASRTLCLLTNSAGEVLTVNPAEAIPIEGAVKQPQPGSTIEYDVPITGTGAPHQMAAKNVEAWGQKEDLPAEAAAIFPEEHPQGWPANGYMGATVYYTDDEARSVNVANPAGGISTTEYHEGDVVRALSADNRERALKEANPAEAAAKLATVSKYSQEGNELTEVMGPEHQVKLANGQEVQARNHVRYFYDEGAPENEKGETEEYGLVTKATDGALLANGEEKDVRTTLTGYSGQEGLGWKLRLPTSTTTEPQGADLVSSTKYNKETGAIEETRSPGGNAETVSPPEPAFSFGSEGSGSGQFNFPQAVAVAPNGDIWVDDKGKSRLEVFSGSGGFIAAYGSAGSGEGQFKEPADIAISKTTGDVYVADTQNNRIEELTSEGQYVRAWSTWTGHQGEAGPEKLEQPVGITVDPAGHVWVSNYENGEVEEFTATGEFMRQFGGKGTGDGQFVHPRDLSFSQGLLYIVDDGNDRVEVFTPAGSYVDQFGGPMLEGAWGIAAAPVTGDLYVSDEAGNDISEFSPDGKYFGSFTYWGSGVGKLAGPAGLAVNGAGELFVADQNNNRVSAWRPAEAGAAHLTYSTQFGSEGSGEGQLEWPAAAAVDPSGDVWVTDNHTGRVEKFSAQGKFLAEYGSQGSEEKQLNGPDGVAVNQATGDVYVGDCNNHRIQERNSEGAVIGNFTSEHLNCPDGIAIDTAGNVWVTDRQNDEIEEFTATGSFLHAYGGKGSGNLQFEEPSGIAIANEKVYVLDTKNNRVQEFSLTGQYLGQFGSEGSGGAQLEDPEGIAADAAGDLFVSDTRNNRIEEFGPNGKYLESISQAGKGDGQLNVPQGLAVTAAGDIYVADGANHRVEKWAPDSQAVHDTKTVYYSPGSEAGVEACENKPQWAGLLCRTEPVVQPTDSAAEPKGEQLPELPVVTSEYNMWYEPVKRTEAVGATTRTKTIVYEGERPVSESTQEVGGSDAPVAPVSLKYSSTLGMLVEQISEARTISRDLNTLGQLESYTDAAGNTTSYSYDQYGRPVEVDYNASKLDQMEARQTLHYDETTGAVTRLEDLGGEGTYGGRGAGAFSATYDVEGNILSETYPNQMIASYAYNSIGEAVSLQYIKSGGCTGTECEWFKDALSPSIHGEALSQQSTLASDQYHYQQPGGLAEVQETPVGEGCATRIYAYNEEADRTSLTTRKPGAEGKCATEGGETERHTYDEANRLTDEEVQYEPLGNITKLPAADAGGHTLETEYYADGQVHSQSQDQKTNTYTLDPEARTLATETIGKELASATVISHYPAPGSSAPSWTYNQTASSWTRNIVSFGGLAAVEESGKQAVLQIRDLEGNIIGTASLSETEGKPRTLERTTEYGVPATEKPADTYNWRGTSGLTSNLASGTIVQDGTTYVPQLGAPLQSAPPEIPAPPLTGIPHIVTMPPPQIAKYEEAPSPAGGAGTPSGNVPEPEEGRIADGCSGGGACDSANTECYRYSKIANLEGGSLAVGGAIACTKSMDTVQIEVCLYEWTGGSDTGLNGYTRLKCGKNHGSKASRTHVIIWDETCKPGGWYLGWIWVFARLGNRIYVEKSPHYTPRLECEGTIPMSPEEITEFFDDVTAK